MLRRSILPNNAPSQHNAMPVSEEPTSARISGRQITDSTSYLVLQIVAAMIRRRNLRTHHSKRLFLDEADELLNRGFREQIYDVYRYFPPTTQVVVVYATLLYDVLDMTKNLMTDSVRILVKRDELTLKRLKQYLSAVDRKEWTFDTLWDLYDTLAINKAVIF